MLVRGKDYSTNDFLNWNVEFIEEQQDIDIQAIKEIEYPAHNLTRDLRDVKINELIRAIKQLDRKIKEGERYDDTSKRIWKQSI